MSNLIDGSLSQRRPPIKSYVKRQGRLTTSQSAAIETFSRNFVLSEHDALDIDSTFVKKNPLIVEIGFGNGRSLVQMAERMPEYNFVGIEVHSPGVGQCLRSLAEKQLINVKLYQADAMHVLQHCLSPRSVTQVNLFFPDPWPKKKHHKRRIVRMGFFQLLRRVLQPLSVIHFASDWQPYVEWVHEITAQLDDFVEIPFTLQHIQRAKTKFEARGELLGHAVSDVLIEYQPTLEPAPNS